MLISHLEQGYISLKKGRIEEIRKDYLRHLYLREVWAVFHERERQFEGKISGVSKEGKLQIELRDGSERSFDLKEITFPNL
jgi:BirA family biotin operon repressor/biotin-[acetyl-CoA-carboxylase] ligase